VCRVREFGLRRTRDVFISGAGGLLMADKGFNLVSIGSAPSSPICLVPSRNRHQTIHSLHAGRYIGFRLSPFQVESYLFPEENVLRSEGHP